MLDYKCPHCNAVLKVPERFAGSTGTCRKCKNTIKIEVDAAAKNGDAPGPVRPPDLIALHLVTTGPSSRRDSIIEIGASKFALDGSERDSFWSFANPGGPLSSSVKEKTGITDDMVAAAAFPLEAVREFCSWAGPNTILFSESAHNHAKFLCAAFLREDTEPEDGLIVDVCSWAEQLEIRAPEYRLRPLLGAIGYSALPGHRAMESARALSVLIAHLLKKEAAALPKDEDDAGVWNLLRGKRADDADPRLFKRVRELAMSVEDACGKHFHMRDAFDKRRKTSTPRNGAGAPTPMILHMPEWYEEKKKYLYETKENGNGGEAEAEPAELDSSDRLWAIVMREAAKSHDPDEQRKLLLKAVSLGARDPWPYERLTGFFIKMHDYHSAQKVCQRYFDGDLWRTPRFVDSSWKLLDRMERLERRISGAA
jgi:DNA polymerase III epsilon subunit-like protein